MDEVALCRQAAAQSIFLAPGRVFRPDRQRRPPRCASTSPMPATGASSHFMRQALAAG